MTEFLQDFRYVICHQETFVQVPLAQRESHREGASAEGIRSTTATTAPIRQRPEEQAEGVHAAAIHIEAVAPYPSLSLILRLSLCLGPRSCDPPPNPSFTLYVQETGTKRDLSLPPHP